MRQELRSSELQFNSPNSTYISVSQNVALEAISPASSTHLLNMQIFRPRPRSTESEAWGLGLSPTDGYDICSFLRTPALFYAIPCLCREGEGQCEVLDSAPEKIN